MTTDLLDTASYDAATDTLTVKTSYDNRAVLAENEYLRNTAPETGRYKGNFVKVGTIHLGDVQRLRNLGYHILSPDPDEVKRALLYIQAEEQALMTVPGKPIGKKKHSWR